jgi:hypothetical protein
MAVTNWNTAPDYDQWGADTWWNCNDWILWHKLLKEKFGQNKANFIWDYSFSQSGNLSGNLNCRTFDSSFRTYVKNNGLNPFANAGIFAPVLKGAGTIQDVTGSAIDTTGNVASGILGTVDSVLGGNNLKKTISVVLIVGGVLGLAYVYKSFKK